MRLQSFLLVAVGGILGVAVIAVGALLFRPAYQFQGSLIDPGLEAPDFTLFDDQGHAFRLKDQRDKVVVLYFGYTSCPDVCPTTLNDLRQMMSQIEDRADRVQVAFITVDPERDTPELVSDYANRFNTGFIGLSGSEDELQTVWDSYWIYRELEPHEPGEYYLVDHTSRVYVIDQNGALRLTFPFGMEPAAMAADVSQLLQE